MIRARVIYIIGIVTAACMLWPVSSFAQILMELTNGTVQELKSSQLEREVDGSFSVDDINIAKIRRIYKQRKQEPIEITPDAKSRVAVLDINGRTGVDEASSNGRNLYSAEYMLQVAGLRYFVTDNLNEALEQSSMILLASNVTKTSIFTSDEYTAMHQWVEDGGVLIAPALEMKEGKMPFALFGISEMKRKGKNHTTVTWIDQALPELAYFDEPEEKEFFIGKKYVETTEYVPSTAQVMANYEDGSAAVLKNVIGKGCTYVFGLRWRDIIQRNQLNKHGSNRVKNNHFDASADMIPFFIRACHAAWMPVTVWKYTIPNGYKTVLIPTHDCDSRTAYDAMHYVADYEKSLGLRAHYFLTTHYFRQQGYMSAFYCDETLPAVSALLRDGHTVGSHSICHFPDFSETSRFPLTETTPEEYAETCTFDVDNKIATGGSTWAEIVMSKQIIERDFGNNVRSFRSGHLCVNDNMPEAMVIGNYNFASCYTASDLWSEFPFFQRKRNAWEGELTDILQMPLHYSDVSPTGVSMGEDNWQEAPDVWLPMLNKLKGNYAPNILLIHPNKEFKMLVLKMFVERFSLEEVGLCNFEDYGDFWINRINFDFETQYDAESNSLTITADHTAISANKGLGLFVESHKKLDKITMTDENGMEIPTRLVDNGDNKYVVVLK